MNTVQSRRALLAGAPAAAAAALAGGTLANAVATGMAKAGEVDPVFAAIAEHVAATKAHVAACSISGWLVDGTRDWETENAVTEAAMERAHDAWFALVTAQPTTVAGVAALLEHVGRNEFFDETAKPGDEGFETVLSSWINGGNDER